MTTPQLTADQNFVRQLNTRLVLDTLRREAPMSRADLSSRTGLNRSTISNIINELIQTGYVYETMIQEQDRVGRPGILLELNPKGGAAIGIEIGVGFISCIVTDFTANVVWRERMLLDEESPQNIIFEQAGLTVKRALYMAEGLGLKAFGIGIGIPGLVDAREGRLVLAPNLHWHDMPLRQMWSERFNLPVFIENEANAAALGEHRFGAARGKDDFIYLSTGIGLGGGIMIGGKLFKGAAGFAGEIGHTKLYTEGELCGCGKRGCLETYAGPHAILRRIRQSIQAGQTSLIADLAGQQLEKISMDMVIEAARQLDPVAQSALHDVGLHLGAGLCNLINIFNPELVVFGGALSPASPWLIPVIREAIQQYALPPVAEIVSLKPSQLGFDSCVMGAAVLVLDEVLRAPQF
jgi:glucokinase-like ROK family protein